MKSPINNRQASVAGRASSLALAAGAAIVLGAGVTTSILLSGPAVGSEGTSLTPAQETEVAIARDTEPAPAAGEIAELGVYGLLRAVPFELESGYTHYYRADQPEVTRGWLLAVRVRTDLVQPTNDFQPVLYADLASGPQTVERFNQGHKDGVLIGFLPELDGAIGALEGVDMWFGAPELPERLTAEMIATEAERARERGGVFELSSSSARTGAVEGSAIRLADRTELEETAAELVLELAPGEKDFAEGFLISR